MVHKVQEVLVSDQVHDVEESAVMRILEKVIFGHQSNLITNFGDDIRSVAELIYHRVFRFPGRAVDERVQAGLGISNFLCWSKHCCQISALKTTLTKL